MFINYEQILPKNWTLTDTRQPSESDSEVEDVLSSRQKKSSRDKCSPQVIITNLKPKNDIAAYIASLAEKDEPLGTVLCENGIASAGK